MSDPTISSEQDLGAMVRQAPDDIWQQIKKALGVNTREEAARMIQADNKARELVLPLLAGQSGKQKTLVTNPQARAKSFVTNSQERPLGSRQSGAQF